ncbi:hypothetical protein ACWDTQ_22900 [Streptomyces cellulosae]
MNGEFDPFAQGTGGIWLGPMGADRYTTISNDFFRDPHLSAKAKGVFGLISTHRNGWALTIPKIVKQMRDGTAAVRAALDELAEQGYLYRERLRNDDGTLGEMIYVVSDDKEFIRELAARRAGTPLTEAAPADAETPELTQNRRSEPGCDFPTLGEPTLENRTYKKNTKKKTKEQEHQAPSARSAPDGARSAPTAGGSTSGSREAILSGSAAPSDADASQKQPATSKKPQVKGSSSGKRMSRKQADAVRAVEASWPQELAALLPQYRPPVLRDAILEALDARTPDQLKLRIERRWNLHFANDALSAEGRGLERPVGVAVALVAVRCPDPMCEDGRIIDTGADCRVCEQRGVDRKARRGLPRQQAAGQLWECEIPSCRKPSRGEKPEDGLCDDCRAEMQAALDQLQQV